MAAQARARRKTKTARRQRSAGDRESTSGARPPRQQSRTGATSRATEARPRSEPKAARTPRRTPVVRRLLWVNSLAIVLFGAFVVFLVLQSIFGWQVRNEELEQAGQAASSYWQYLGTGHFAEATFENW